MTAISTAIGSERRSRVSGYKITKGFFGNSITNLPQQIVILAEANTANQSLISTAKREVTSAEEAGRIYGFGSPIHQIMRILRPISGDGVGGIPTIVMAQLEDTGAVAAVVKYTISNTATKSGTHYIVLAGRDRLDYKAYSYNVVAGDSSAIVAQKIVDSINAVLSAPVIASKTGSVVSFTAKWKGVTSTELKVTIDINGDTLGVGYALTTRISGVGDADISAALDQFGDDWYTTVINSYGEQKFADLENFNGVPDEDNPTGRYAGRVFKPFLSFSGLCSLVISDYSDITDNEDRVIQVTNVLCPAPGSEGFPWEAAANMVALFARVMQDSPHLDVAGKSYPDMPTPLNGDIGEMKDYNNRDLLVKVGCSTVAYVNGAYQVQDLVTTYHLAGEDPLQFNYARNLNLDWNVKDGYGILENQHVKDHVIIRDEQTTDVQRAIKPKEWKAILFNFFDALSTSALINEPDFSKESLAVEIDATNPNRFNTRFRYKRTGINLIQSTDAQAGF